MEDRYDPGNPEASDKVVKISNVDLQYGYLTEDLLQDLDPQKILGWLTKGDAPGKGWGANIGFTYEYRPDVNKYQYSANGQDYVDRQKDKYKYRVSIALVDLGKIRYTNPNFVRSFNLIRTNKEVLLRDFEGAENTDDYTRVLNESLDIEPSDAKTSFESGLPTAVNLNFDYKLKGPFYVNATWIQSLTGKYAISMHQPSLLAVTPRLDTKGLTVALPFSLNNDYSVFSLGGMFKFGPYFIGSDNIGGAFNIGKPYGANVYTGLSFSIGQAKKKDKKVKMKKGSPAVPPTISPPAPAPAAPEKEPASPDQEEKPSVIE